MNGFEIFGIGILSVIGAIFTYAILHVLTLLIMAMLVNPKKEYERSNKFYETFFSYTLRIVLILGRVKVLINGKEKIPTDDRFLFVANHASNFDPLIVLAVLGKHNIRFISKPQNFKIFILGRLLHRMKFLSMDRDSARNSLKTLLKAVEYVKNDECSIGVYPEGMRSFSRELLPFHDGVFKIAIKANVPVVVASMVGQEVIKNKFPFKKSIVYFDILEVLPVQEKVTSHDLAEKARTLIQNKLDEYKDLK